MWCVLELTHVIALLGKLVKSEQSLEFHGGYQCQYLSFDTYVMIT